MTDKSEQKKQVQKKKVQWKNLLARLLLIIVLSSLVIVASVFVNWLVKPGNFPFKKVELVNQLANQESRELQEVAAKVLNGGFFSLNVDYFRQDLLAKLPWVKMVSVRKVWPDKLLIEITEYRPVVRWQSVDKTLHLLSQEGVIFSPRLTMNQKEKFARLALFSGPESSAETVLQQCFTMNNNLKKIALTIKKCGMNKRRAWFLELTSTEVNLLDDIDIQLGKENVMQQLERFVQVFSGKLKRYLSSIERVDLRYANGFSVKWNEVSKRNESKIK
ncbi:cell division protein FtsQ/DivIB [sulfur-oxidizing endosymbiont of Gigantopelta aegis]|uniref:cell division protein FtsQ/DivIB n=1 Tax=sulfur-oxidizing endosymbiont of Gigantopelta aegis TaxID=2794934 RepID=UPI0018DB72DF|nr:cell division protein FtsQ/DivIB [sulfur-oxidizing endosymbiont of Gigantopelta aegis]